MAGGKHRSTALLAAIAFVLCLFYSPARSEGLAMMDERKTLVFRVSMAVTKGLSLVRGMKQLNEEQRKRVAEAIIHELEITNWTIKLGEPGRPPG
jgi:hypothetical protein